MISSQLSNLNRYRWGGTPAKTPAAPRPAAPRAPASISAADATTAARNALPLAPTAYDTNFDATVNGVSTNLANTNIGLANDENALGADYGVQFDRNPDGTLGNFRLDTSNPFSRAALLQRSFQQRANATNGQLASQGQLYSGYRQSKQNENTFDNQQSNDALLKGFGSQARAIMDRRIAAQQAATGQIGDAGLARVQGNAQLDPGLAPQPNAAQILAQISGGNVKLTGKGLFAWNPATKQYDIPVGA